MPLFLLSQTRWVGGYTGDKEEKTWDGGQVHRKQRDVNSATHEAASFEFYQPALKKTPKHQNLSFGVKKRFAILWIWGWTFSPYYLCPIYLLCSTSHEILIKIPTGGWNRFQDSCLSVHLLLPGNPSLFCIVLLQELVQWVLVHN